MQLNYHPKSIAFALHLDCIQCGEQTSVQSDGLPFFRPGKLYAPISDIETQQLDKVLSGNPVLKPLHLLNHLETFGQHQVSY